MSLLNIIKDYCNYTKRLVLDKHGIAPAVLAALIGAGGSILGGLFGGGDEDRETTVEYQYPPFSYSHYPPGTQAAQQAVYGSLFGTPATTPMSFQQWVSSQGISPYMYGGGTGLGVGGGAGLGGGYLPFAAPIGSEKPIFQQTQGMSQLLGNLQQQYQDYLSSFQPTEAVPSATQGIVGGALPYYQTFLEQQLPLALSPYEQFLQSTPDLEWQIIQGDLGRQLQEAQLQQQQYYSQYGTAGAGAQDWERMYGGYMGDLAQQRRLLEAGWGERQMQAGAGYAGLAGMAPQTASAMVALQMMPYDYQMQYLNMMLGKQPLQTGYTQTAPQYTPNWLTQALQGAATGAYIYGQTQQPTTQQTSWYNFPNIGSLGSIPTFNQPWNYMYPWGGK